MTLITVFTPAYNRAYTLRRCYESLRTQSFQDFEWLVVDDGSTDETEALIAELAQSAPFSVVFIRHSANRGKHAASNTAVQRASGELFLTLDSDDYLTPNALHIFASTWLNIPEIERSKFAAVTGLCLTPDGELLGDAYPKDVFDSTPLESFYRYRVTGDKFGFTRTDIMRAHLFPDTPDVDFVPEGIIWNAIGVKYLTRYINRAVLVKDYQADGFTLGGRKTGSAGAALYLGELLNIGWKSLLWRPTELFKVAAHFVSKSDQSGHSLIHQWCALRGWVPRVVWSIALPVGLLHSRLMSSRFQPVIRRTRIGWRRLTGRT